MPQYYASQPLTLPDLVMVPRPSPAPGEPLEDAVHVVGFFMGYDEDGLIQVRRPDGSIGAYAEDAVRPA